MTIMATAYDGRKSLNNNSINNNNRSSKRLTFVVPPQVRLFVVALVFDVLLLCGGQGGIVVVTADAAASATANTDHSNHHHHEPRTAQKPPGSEATAAVRKLAATSAPNVLNVHVVPHTHDDVGWLKTVEQYYDDDKNNSIDARGSVRRILSTTVQALTEQPARTFTYTETKYFAMWWNEQNEAVKDTVRYLVANQQWTFVNGGWCMHDEATTHFMGMIDQTTTGHSFLANELGVIPVTGWQLDPFGHSITHANLLTYAAGMNALYFGRIDYQDLQWRQTASACEGLWQTSPTNRSNNETEEDTATIFWGLTGSYHGNYGPPEGGFCFDVLCGDEPLVGANSTRLMQRITDFLHAIQLQSNQTRGNHIMLTMGTDFTFREAHVDYSNLDLLIGATMNYQQWNLIDIPSIFPPRFDRINIFYSNPDYYTEQKYKETLPRYNEAASQTTTAPPPIEWPVKTDDFFPYSDCPHCFWTGYFTSRAAFKRLERVASSFLLAVRQLDAMSLLGPATVHRPTEDADGSALFALEDALGIAQHHDAVAGTAKQHVADDYSMKLSTGMNRAALRAVEMLQKVMLKDGTGQTLDNLSYCPLLNETICPVSEEATASNDTIVYVIVYNPLAQNRSSAVVRLPVIGKASFRVERIDEGDPTVQFLHSVVTTDFSKLSSLDRSSDENTMDLVKHELVFGTGMLPPVGAVAFRIVKEPSSAFSDTSPPVSQLPLETSTLTERRLQSVGTSESVEFSTGLVSAAFDIATGMLTGLSTEGVTLAMNQTWGYYESYDSNLDKSDSQQNSGAYIFRPSTPDQKLLPLIPKLNGAKFVKTSVGIEVHASFRQPWLQQVSRIVTGEPYVEVEYTVGPIPIGDGRGKDIVALLSTSINSDGVFYTDANGREFQKRKRNFRSSWDMEIFEPIAGNFYPVNAAIYVEDSEAALAILVDRSQGGASLVDGSLELMVQRRTVVDDQRGVNEPLNETCGGMTPYPPYGNSERIGDGVVIKGKFRILVGKGAVGASLARSEMDGTFAEPVVFVASRHSSDPATFQQATFSSLQTALPTNVMLITFMRIPGRNNTTFLVRLGHQYAPGEHDHLSNPADVDLSNLFVGYNVTSIKEKTLTGNQDWEEHLARRIDWTGMNSNKQAIDSSQTKITMAPLQVRTFYVTWSPSL